MLIKYLLSSIIISIGIYSWMKLQKTLLVRGLIFTTTLLFVVLVFIPQYTTIIANHFGVHRGVDFIFYLAFLFAYFCIIFLYKKNRRLEQKLAQLIRDIAIERAVNSNSKKL
ncbi:DUF2304 domain-containing protein [Pedobacter frigoris]|uniref:DUF2304 domain-containing protein n=1 Tax=Pedobacter frigoris TaxID=2571272 RepID=A0A4U1CP12_9SPHI|nr:DUF2304 domain-containing protein [Pedobacter frigoris]